MNFNLLSPGGIVIILAFFIAGVIDAVCGGGGLLTLPLFMTTGFPVHYITGTNQCSIFFGSATSFLRFAKGGHIHWRSALPSVPLAILGAFLGARLNMAMPRQWLEFVMILLVPIVAVVLLLKRDFGSENHVSDVSPLRRVISTIFIGLVIGMYQGFYGAGSGTFFMLAFAILLRLDLTTASGNTKLVSFCCIASSAATYAFSGAVYWPLVAAATVTNIAGSYVGAGLAMKRGAKFIRPMFFFVLALLFIRLVVSWFA